MPVTVKMQRTEEVVVTAANEAEILGQEWDRRYADRPFSPGDEVEFCAIGKQKHIDAFGPEHIGKRGIVVNVSDHADVKVLAISMAGIFEELWTPEAVLVAVG